MSARLSRDVYESELFRLQAELVKLQEWVRGEKARVVVVFEGRDAAGKGSAIKRVAEAPWHVVDSDDTLRARIST